ncbi:PaaI family thioesterase [Massilia sp. DWR3-1-1]|uniref:PaaI family thioesterase n=1 Tax=Massilia sp. DWR3-1-1 TaxID=2804559 RepID=UPI003CF2CA6D
MNDTDSVKQAWIDEAALMRARLAPPGVAGREALSGRSGEDFLAGISRGELPAPPIGELMGMTPLKAVDGHAVFQGTPGPEHYNPLGAVHGGYAATLLDTAVGCAIHSLLPAGRGYTTLELKINYVRAITVNTGPVRAEGKVIHLGGQTAIAEGRLLDAAGKLLAYATTTCLVFPI